MTREEISKIEHGFFFPAYDLFEKRLRKLNSPLKKYNKEINLLVEDNFNLNAHAKKDGNGFEIVLLSGLIPMTFDILSENVDFFMEEYPDLKEKEAAVGLGCVFIWNHIFGHELGHILRGHLSFIETKETNLIGNYHVTSMAYNVDDEGFSESHIRTLMEYDADIFSAKFVADILLNTIKKAREINIEEKSLIGLCLTSIFFFFNSIGKLDKGNSKYPPAMVRANTLQSYIVRHLLKKTRFSDEELEDIMNASVYSAYSHLVDNKRLSQSIDNISLDELAAAENNLLRIYPAFDKVLTEGLML